MVEVPHNPPIDILISREMRQHSALGLNFDLSFKKYFLNILCLRKDAFTGQETRQLINNQIKH